MDMIITFYSQSMEVYRLQNQQKASDIPVQLPAQPI